MVNCKVSIEGKVHLSECLDEEFRKLLMLLCTSHSFPVRAIQFLTKVIVCRLEEGPFPDANITIRCWPQSARTSQSQGGLRGFSVHDLWLNRSPMPLAAFFGCPPHHILPPR